MLFRVPMPLMSVPGATLVSPRLAESLNPGLKRGRATKMPVENFAEIWYHGYIVSLFIKEITNEQEE